MEKGKVPNTSLHRFKTQTPIKSKKLMGGLTETLPEKKKRDFVAPY